MEKFLINACIVLLMFISYMATVNIPNVPQQINPFNNYGFVVGQSYRREWNLNSDRNPFMGETADTVKVIRIKKFWIELNNGQQMSIKAAQYYNWFTLPDATKQ